ncbi:probable E3 ubiquitin-protein ligase ATL44 [Ananas comosus]|uniref:E3 ubiquitin-protein ligase n=1 Tax=Ananas comosus TaxID=4615 RepID=A0A199VDE4_ANACO|nr:probable E3 ubiquitin-protein ligase ATL44 [Ananas comosus]XP_020092915.1 probable E3 ubiquitin-protein ligase ATL44 [Ananas comosus]OAY75114.1 E3 ubiquitin-protein ligase [Ananas comosus]OAY76233.1 E3 ubiquitin-protein ligase [Ananas comosus]
MPELYAYRVLADDNAAARFEEPAIPSWSSLSFGIILHIRNIIHDVDEHGVRRSVYVDPPFERILQFQCVHLCPGREDFCYDRAFGEASEIMTSMLDACTGHVVPPSTREAIAADFGRLACQMLCDGRYARCRRLPTIVEITVFSARPMISRLWSTPPEPASAWTLKALEHCRLIPSGASEEEEETCPICLAEIPAQSPITRMPCSHFFHEECIVRWLRINRICPLCRSVLPR